MLIPRDKLYSVAVILVISHFRSCTGLDALFSGSFDTALYKNIIKTRQSSQNIALSPFSAEAALGLAFAGAGGSTKQELAAALGIKPDTTAEALGQVFLTAGTNENNTFTLNSAYGVYFQNVYKILPAYRDSVEKNFGAKISMVDFTSQAEAARKDINDFVTDKTKNKIQDLIPVGVLDAMTKMVLVNALYFKADWDRKFRVEKTVDMPFTLADGQQKTASLMWQRGFYRYTESEALGGAQVLELAFKGYDTSMVFILPAKESGAMQALEEKLTGEAVQGAIDKLARTQVIMYIPKFKINMGFDLSATLTAMGIKSAFSDNADFTGMSDKRDLAISSIQQKVVIEIDEKGSEAAAATFIAVMTRGAPFFPSKPPPKMFRADHPFLFFLRHKGLKATMFMGRVSDPTAH